MVAQMASLKKFLFERMYRHPSVKVRTEHARRVVASLFAHFHAEPLLLPEQWRAVAAGARRAGGTYLDRGRRIVIWNTVMDEYNYAARAWERFVRRVNEAAAA
jgi:dGTP triphosphohydrolase